MHVVTGTSDRTATLRSERNRARPLVPYLTFVHPVWRHLRITAREQTVGRGAQAAFRLESEAVSRQHARLRALGPDSALIENDATKNKVTVNGAVVDRAELSPGDVVRIGDQLAIMRACADEPRNFVATCPNLWGTETLTDVVSEALRAAESTVPILITGESGTGKEHLARAIHEASRPGKPFVPVNCAALAESLLDAELFGHERGAYTGAVGARDGLVRQANGGTLFLDELAELSKPAQAKLLRVLQEGEVNPLGGKGAQRVNVRFLAATHADLVPMVDAGDFRHDLYHRLVGVHVELPSLRTRREDVLPLFRLFLRLPEAAPARWSIWLAEALCLYDWPGNVRELQLMTRALAVQHRDKEQWTKAELPKAIADAPSTASSKAGSASSPRYDEGTLRQRLEANGYNVTYTASELRMTRPTLYNWMKKFGIQRPGS